MKKFNIFHQTLQKVKLKYYIDFIHIFQAFISAHFDDYGLQINENPKLKKLEN